MHTLVPQQSRKHRVDTWIESLVLAVILGLAIAALLGGCLAEKKNVDSSGSATIPAWTDLTATGGVLKQDCATSGCHAGSSPSVGLSLDADQYTAIVTNGQMSVQDATKRIVEPGSKSASQLYIKITNGGSMATHISAAGIADIGNWIDAGAQQ